MTNSSLSKSYKVWSFDREIKKSILANNLDDLKAKAAKKLGYNLSHLSEFRLVLEADGTEIEDDQYFQTAAQNTIFILLKDQERWLPQGVEELKAAIAAFPGNVTVVLQLDKKNFFESDLKNNGGWRIEFISKSKDEKLIKSKKLLPHKESIKNLSSNDTEDVNFNFDGLKNDPSFAIYKSSPSQTLKSDESNFNAEEEEEVVVEEEEEEEEEYGSVEKSEKVLSPNNYIHDHSKCDFHCSSLHREGAQIKVNRGSHLFRKGSKGFEVISGLPGTDWQKNSPKSRVRFLDSKKLNMFASNSETVESESLDKNEHFSECYLILVDKLSIDRQRHLTIKDIGIILEHLNFKIVDVDCLEREKMSQDCYNWMIKATIKGETLKNLGVIYNGQYYKIMEHPKWTLETLESDHDQQAKYF